MQIEKNEKELEQDHRVVVVVVVWVTLSFSYPFCISQIFFNVNKFVIEKN